MDLDDEEDEGEAKEVCLADDTPEHCSSLAPTEGFLEEEEEEHCW